MDILSLIFWGSLIYLIWFYWRKRKLTKQAQEELKKAQDTIDYVSQQINMVADEMLKTSEELKKKQ